jgi:hypothetical protein
MNDQQKKEQYSGVRDQEIRAALDQHWAASDANDFETEHRIYHEDAVLEYPQSGERTRGRRNIQNQRASQPSKKRFAVRRIVGSGDLWITEFILTYDGKPSYTVSIMEFRDDKVARETQYFADPFVAPAWRAQCRSDRSVSDLNVPGCRQHFIARSEARFNALCFEPRFLVGLRIQLHCRPNILVTQNALHRLRITLLLHWRRSQRMPEVVEAEPNSLVSSLNRSSDAAVCACTNLPVPLTKVRWSRTGRRSPSP